jgi:UDP-galactopyranose mutase
MADRHRTTRRLSRAPTIRSFWMVGFDGTDHLGGARELHGVLDASRYRARVESDYRAARDAGIACVRESIGWRRIARTAAFDFETVAIRAECARGAGLQVVWTLCDGGWPDDVDVCASAFVEQFRRYASAVARQLARCGDDEPPVYAPVNEISFLSWALAETALICPQRSDLRNRGYELKQQLVRAAIATCDAILEVDPRARFLHVEPAMHPAPGGGRDASVRDVQFQAWDMLVGRLEPQLGGHPRYLDVAGIHCHHTARWRRGKADGVSASSRSGSRLALHRLLGDVHARYDCPLVVCETNRVTATRGEWLRELGDQIGVALEHGVPVLGACLCRAVERPAWEDPRYWRGRRLWDVLLHPGDDAPRVPDSAYEQALRDLRARIDPLLAQSPHR